MRQRDTLQKKERDNDEEINIKNHKKTKGKKCRFTHTIVSYHPSTKLLDLCRVAGINSAK